MQSFISLFTFIYLFSSNICFNTASSLSSISLLTSSGKETELLKDDFLDDFEFENRNDDSLEITNSTKLTPTSSLPAQSIKPNNINTIENEESEVIHEYLPIKKKMIKNAVTKSLTHKALSQKFVEVIPILRVLSSQQKIALSSLISAQISAKPGTELKLSQVRSIFGNNQKLILPLVLDIANMVRNAAKSSLNNNYDLSIENEDSLPTTITATSSSSSSVSAENNLNRRVFEQSTIKKNNNDNFGNNNENDYDNYYGEIMDPIIINNELYDAYHQDKGNNSTDIKINVVV